MSAAPAVKPKNLTAYYAALEAYEKQGVTHEGALRSAFQNLLAETGRRTGWTLIPELVLGSIRPDGTFRDEYFLNRGYWEAKDTNDFLESLLKQRGQPRLRLLPPYREHLSQAFARFFMRVGLPVQVAQAW